MQVGHLSVPFVTLPLVPCITSRTMLLQANDNWFYIPDYPLNTLSSLIQVYHDSLGRNANWYVADESYRQVVFAQPPCTGIAGCWILHHHLIPPWWRHTWQGICSWVIGFEAAMIIPSRSRACQKARPRCRSRCRKAMCSTASSCVKTKCTARWCMSTWWTHWSLGNGFTFRMAHQLAHRKLIDLLIHPPLSFESQRTPHPLGWWQSCMPA